MATVGIQFALLSVSDAAEALGYTTGRVRQLLRAGLLRGKKLNSHVWLVDQNSVESLKMRQIPGRVRRLPSGKKNS